MPAPRPRYAYLHGFASSAGSHKGTALAQRLAKIGVPLELPDLNRPSFGELTVDAALGAIDDLDASTDAPEDARPPWRFIGSSMGGFLAARWAQLHPARVDRLILLCPGFGLAERWPEIIGAEAFERWREQGWMHMPDGQGKLTRVHWGFVESAMAQPAYPRVPCPTTIIHGTRDEVVPVQVSRDYVAGLGSSQDAPAVELVEVDDDHGLVASLDLIEHRCRNWLTRHTYVWDFFGPEAAGTAEHFEVHLREFLEREQITGWVAGTERGEADGSASPRNPAGIHVRVWLDADVIWEPILRRALRPHRKT